MEMWPESHDYEGWANLFSTAADALSRCQQIDTSGALPSQCKHESAQFQAWRFGRLVAMAGVIGGDLREHLLSMANDEFGLREIWGDQVAEKWWGILRVVAALICEYDASRDCKMWLEQLMDMWRGACTCPGTLLCEIGPDCDLYWAMRVGFADLILEKASSAQDDAVQSAVVSIGLRVVKIGRELEAIQRQLELLVKRSSPHPDEVRQDLERSLGPTWKRLPSEVTDRLVAAEQGYAIGTRTDTALLDFFAALEACFRCYFVNHFVGINLQLGRPPSKLSLGQWADHLDSLLAASHREEKLRHLKVAIEQKWPKLNWAELCCLAQGLHSAQKLRNHVTHSTGPAASEQRRQELERIRSLALGIEGPSIISLIFQLFG